MTGVDVPADDWIFHIEAARDIGSNIIYFNGGKPSNFNDPNIPMAPGRHIPCGNHHQGPNDPD
jgi:hypothetical protein